MPSCYLRPEDYAPYGVPSATVAQVISASGLIDGYLRRPEGMIWMPDYAGLPCYMKAMQPQMTFVAAGPIAIGTNIPVVVTTKLPNMTDLIGDVAVVDRTSVSVEPAVIQNVEPGNILVLRNVDLPHPAGTKLELGMCILEERTVSPKRSIARVSKSPIMRLLSGLGRYGYGRRLDQKMGMYGDASLLASVQAFGGAPAWIPFDIAQASISQPTNEVWLPPGMMLAYFSECRLRYIAGYSDGGMPDILRLATARAIEANLAVPELAGNIKMAKAGQSAIERFSNSVMDTDLKSMLDEFRARLVV